MDTEPWPPRRGSQENFIVKNEVWAAAGMPPGKVDPDGSIRGGGILCVGCIEKRLGRLLTRNDFPPQMLDILKGCHSTPRLLSRLGVDFKAIANNPLPEHMVKWWTRGTIRNVLKRQPLGKGLIRVEIDGDAVTLIYKRGKKFEAVCYQAGPKLKALMAKFRQDQIPKGDGIIDFLPWEDEAA
jgi:hypothetical protein